MASIFWHLFSNEESFKLDTFLHGGLWCPDLGSSIGFTGDSEGSKFHGIFVSCWHVNKDDPSDVAWQIFGGQGDGFAIRTSAEKLLALVNTVETGGIKARLCEVSYLPPSASTYDLACQVSESHAKEEEVRFVVTFAVGSQVGDCLKDKIRALVPSRCRGLAYERPIHHLTLSEIDGMDLGLIVPINPDSLFEEFLVGPKVTAAARKAAKKKLRKFGLHCQVRDLQKGP